VTARQCGEAASGTGGRLQEEEGEASGG
jgi:hypothetical protein